MRYVQSVKTIREEITRRTAVQCGAFILDVIRSAPLTYRRTDTGQILSPADLANLRSRYPEATIIVDDIA